MPGTFVTKFVVANEQLSETCILLQARCYSSTIQVCDLSTLQKQDLAGHKLICSDTKVRWYFDLPHRRQGHCKAKVGGCRLAPNSRLGHVLHSVANKQLPTTWCACVYKHKYEHHSCHGDFNKTKKDNIRAKRTHITCDRPTGSVKVKGTATAGKRQNVCASFLQPAW